MNKILIKDIIIIALILIPSLLFYLYQFFPEVTNFDFYFFHIDLGSYDELQSFVWHIGVKLLTLNLLSWWFVTAKSIIRYAIVVAVVIEIFKIYATFTLDENAFYNPHNYLYTLVIASIYIFLLYIISKKLAYQKRTTEADLNKEINQQLVRLTKFNIKEYNSIKKKILILQSNKDKLNKEEYLKRLLYLRDKLIIN